MSEITQSTKTPASIETAFLNRKWKSMLFFFVKRAFESKLQGCLPSNKMDGIGPHSCSSHRIAASRVQTDLTSDQAHMGKEEAHQGKPR